MRCKFVRLIYPKPEQHSPDGYMVAVYKPVEKVLDLNGQALSNVRVTGHYLPTAQCVQYDLSGQWVNGKYGVQYALQSYKEIIAPSKEGIVGYLSALVKGIGPKTAERIYHAFGTDTLNVLDQTPQKLLQVQGITPKKLEAIRQSYLEHCGERDLVATLLPYNIKPKKAVQIYKHFGHEALDIVRFHPYRLCEIHGIGFFTADEIAKSMGLGPLSDERIDAAILHALQQAESDGGHVCVTQRRLLSGTHVLLSTPQITDDAILSRVEFLLHQNQLAVYGSYLYRKPLAVMEDAVACSIASHTRLGVSVPDDTINRFWPDVQKEIGFLLHQEQKQAVLTAVKPPMTVITGGPGTGKTSIQRAPVSYTHLDVYKRQPMPQPSLLCNTKDMPRKRWLECREHGPNGDIPFTLGGSDIATVFGINPWKTPLELFMEKRGLLAPNEDENAKQKELGHLLEPVVARVFAAETGSEIIEDYGMYQHAEYPFAIADIDYLYRQGTTEGVLECKSTTYHKAGDYQNDRTPIHYELQVRFYLEVRQYETGELACLWGNNPDTDFVHRTIRYDKHISREILEGAKEFIHRLENNDPPPMDGVPSKLAVKALNRIYDNVKDSPPVEFSSVHEPALRKIVELQKHKMEPVSYTHLDVYKRQLQARRTLSLFGHRV